MVDSHTEEKDIQMLSSMRIYNSNENIIFEKGLDKETFQYFIKDVVPPELREGDVVIMDKYQQHKINFE